MLIALLPLPIQTGTLIAQRLSARSRTQVLAFNVVACVAVAVVVVNGSNRRVPRVLLRHVYALLYAPAGAIREIPCLLKRCRSRRGASLRGMEVEASTAQSMSTQS